MSRLTKRNPNGHVTLQENIVPIGCSRTTFCSRKNGPYAQDDKRDCPMLRMIWKTRSTMENWSKQRVLSF